jgi:pimeloyl-ACP methyl ester carboxylesterase
MKSLLRSVLWCALFLAFILAGTMGYFYLTQETSALNDENRKTLSGNFVKLSRGHTHYEIAGPDTGKIIILIHGAGSGYYAWNKNFEFLISKGFRVLRYDLYGRGFSDRPEGVYDPALFEQQLCELIDSLHLNKSYSLASVSMGAIIAIKHTLLFPERIKSMIMIDPAALNEPHKPAQLTMPVVSDLLMTAYWYPRAIEKQMNEFYDPKKVEEYAIISAEQMKYKGFKRAMKSTWLNTLNQNEYQDLVLLGNAKKKTLLLWGQNDPLISSKVSEHYIRAIPSIEYHEIEKAGHLANYEQPEVVNSFIYNFLASE